MSGRTRWVIALGVAAVVFALVVWIDAGILQRARQEASATFTMGSFLWLWVLANLAVAAAAILFGGLAWWSQSLLVSLVFLLAGLAETLTLPLVFGNYGLPDALNYNLVGWTQWTSGPTNAALIMGAALATAGVIGIYRWLTTRQVAA